MKKTTIFTLIIFPLLLLFSCADEKTAKVERDINFYYMELCPGCESYEAAERIAGTVIRMGGKASNIIHDEDARAMKELLESKGLENLSHVLPLLVTEEGYFVGYEEIEAEANRIATE